MVYNRTKRALELTAGIFGVVVACGTLITGLYLFITFIFVAIALTAAGLYASVIIAIIFTFLWFVVSICAIIFNAMIIKSPVRPEGVLRTTKIRVMVIIFSVLSLNFVTFGLEIAVMCLKDFEEPSRENKMSNIYVQMPAQTQETAAQPKRSSLEENVAELKHLKELGVIDEEAYNKAVTKLIEKL